MKDEETLEQYLQRGGKITKCDAGEHKADHFSRYKITSANQEHRFSMAERLENYKKKSGGKIPKHTKMYLAFRKRFGV